LSSQPLPPQPAAGNAAGSGEAERRVAVRYPSTAPNRDCEVETAEQEERWPAVIRDISQTGMGLFVGRPFDPGTLLEVELEKTRRRRRRMVLAMRVVHLRRQDGGWLLGCVLETELTEAQLAGLV
jgi:hypothetical protein